MLHTLLECQIGKLTLGLVATNDCLNIDSMNVMYIWELLVDVDV